MGSNISRLNSIKTITTCIININMFNVYDIYTQTKSGKHRLFLPYKKMSQTMRKSVNKSDIERWVELELGKYGDTSTTLPPLKTRLHMLGHQKPVYPKALTQTAAEYYLDTSMQQLLITSFDKSWLRTSGRSMETD